MAALALQCAIFATALLVTKRGRRKTNANLSVLLYLILVQLVFDLLEGHGIFMIPVSRSLSLLYGPILASYTLSITKPHFIGRPFYLLSFLMFLCGLGFYYIIPDKRVMGGLTIAIFVVYLFYSCRLAVGFHKSQRGLYPSLKSTSFQWIIELFIGVVLVIFINIRSEFLHTEFLFNTLMIILFLVINLIGFRGVLQLNSFLGIPENVILAARDSKEKYVNSPLCKKDIQKYADSITHALEKDQLHLDPDLTLTAFSQHIDLPPRWISQVINQHFGRNFSDFINEHRLEHAKYLLGSTTNIEKNISQIIYESGFNSKTRFYTYFKKRTGLSPKAFRNLKNNLI